MKSSSWKRRGSSWDISCLNFHGQGDGVCGKAQSLRDKASGRNWRWVLKHFLGQEWGSPAIWHKLSLKYTILIIDILHFIMLIPVANWVELKMFCSCIAQRHRKKYIILLLWETKFSH